MTCPFSQMFESSYFGCSTPIEKIRNAIGRCEAVKVDESGTEGYWAVLSIELIDFISKNPEKFSSYERSAMPEDYCDAQLDILRNQFINMDPPEHSEYRRLITKFFTDSAIAKLSYSIEESARYCIQSFFEGGGGDFVSKIATPTPYSTMLGLMGFPKEDYQQVSRLVNNVLYSDDEDCSSAFFLYVLESIQSQNGADDSTIVGTLLNATVENKLLALDRVVSYIGFVIIAGASSTQALIAHGARLLLENPKQYAMLRTKPALLDGFIEELLRFSPPFICMRRTAKEKVFYKEIRFKKGDDVILFYPVANRCAVTFGEDSHLFDVTRSSRIAKTPSKHRAFGVGEHFCLGNQLARLELRSIFRMIFAQERKITYLSPPEYFSSNHLSSIKRLDVSIM